MLGQDTKNRIVKGFLGVWVGRERGGRGGENMQKILPIFFLAFLIICEWAAW